VAYDARLGNDYGANLRAPSDEREVEQQAIRVRNAALDRMRKASTNHGMYAFDVVSSTKRFGPHAVVFLYQDVEHREGMHPRVVMRAADRKFWDNLPEFLHLPTVLQGLADTAAGFAGQGGFDPRKLMAHNSEKMSGRAEFAGVAVSTLDTPAGPWVTVRQRIQSSLEVGGRSYIALKDTTKLILDRGGPFGVNGTTWSTHPLEMGSSMGSYGTWKTLRRNPQDADEEVWFGLDTLLSNIIRGLRPDVSTSRRAR
jgi:hypothetical protein